MAAKKLNPLTRLAMDRPYVAAVFAGAAMALWCTLFVDAGPGVIGILVVVVALINLALWYPGWGPARRWVERRHLE